MKTQFGKYANQWAIGITLVHYGFTYFCIVFDLGPFWFEIRQGDPKR